MVKRWISYFFHKRFRSMKYMITLRKKRMVAVAVLGSVAVGMAVVASASPPRVFAQSMASPTVSGSTSGTQVLFQETANSITAIVDEIQASPSSISPAEMAQLMQAITAFQNILRAIVPNTVATPFH